MPRGTNPERQTTFGPRVDLRRAIRAAYAAWMYELAEDLRVVRAWGQRQMHCAQQHWIAVTYGSVYDSLGFATPPP